MWFKLLVTSSDKTDKILKQISTLEDNTFHSKERLLIIVLYAIFIIKITYDDDLCINLSMDQ